MTTALDGGGLSALRTGRLCPQENTPVTHFCLRLSRPQDHSVIGRIMSMKNPQTPVGIEAAAFRFVAQHLNHCATAVPHNNNTVPIYLKCHLFAARIIIVNSNSLLGITFAENLFEFEFQKQPLQGGSLGKTNVKRSTYNVSV